MKKRILSVVLVLTMLVTPLSVSDVYVQASSGVMPEEIIQVQEPIEELVDEEYQELVDDRLSDVYKEALRQATEFQQTDEYKKLIDDVVEQQEEVESIPNIQLSFLGDLPENTVMSPVYNDLSSEDYQARKEKYVEELEIKASKEWISSSIMMANSTTMANSAVTAYIMSNKYIGSCINSYGRLTLGTTGGNPESDKDDNKSLLYGYPGGSTSYTTVHIDGQVGIFYPNGGIIVYPNELKSIATMVVGDITIQQVATLGMNYSTGREDMAGIQYIVSNNGTTSHSVGIRIMLDTMLGDNDGVPFRIAGIGNVTSEIELSGNSIPQYWQAFDNFEQPSVIANGCFYKSVSNKPDKV